MRVEDQVDADVPAELVALFTADDTGWPLRIIGCVCGECGGRVFSLHFDDDAGAVQRECSGCGSRAFIADSENYWADAEPCVLACPCDSEEFEVAVAFALRDDGSVRWITVGGRCQRDGATGICADWKIDYGPTDHLLSQV